MSNRLKLDRRDGVFKIKDDRAFLNAIGMSDAEAAMYLGKSRQAINIQLGSKRSPRATPVIDYFKANDVLVLVNTARHLGRIDAGFNTAISDYLLDKEQHATTEQCIAIGVVKELLGLMPLGDMAAGHVTRVVFVLPGFGSLIEKQKSAFDELRALVKRSIDIGCTQFAVLAPTLLTARMAAQALDLDRISGCQLAGNEVVEHYGPTILLYDDKALSKALVLTENGVFVQTVAYRLEMMRTCVESLINQGGNPAMEPPVPTVARAAN